MKKRTFVTATLSVLSLIVAAQAVQADEPMLVNIPFAFVAGNETLPAGEYRVQKLDGNSTVVLIRCSDAKASAMVLSNAAQAKETQTQSKLVFKRYDNRYFLSQVWKAGSIRGRELLKSQAEKEIAQSASVKTTGSPPVSRQAVTTSQPPMAGQRTGSRSPQLRLPFSF